MNRLIILETIEKESPISRVDILRVTKTSSPTVSLVVEHFLKIGTVRDAGVGESSGGRKPTLIELNSNGGFIIGIDLGGINTNLVLVNSSGKIVKRIKGSVIDSNSKNKILNRLKELIHNVISQLNTDKGRVLEIGLGVSGITDEFGKVSFALEIVEKVIEYLAIGLTNISALLNLEMIVLGGEVTKHDDILLKPLREKIAKIMAVSAQIVASCLGEDIGVIGATPLSGV